MNLPSKTKKKVKCANIILWPKAEKLKEDGIFRKLNMPYAAAA